MGLRGRAAAVALAATALATAAAGCGGSNHESQTTRPAAPTLSSPFAYDASRPLAFRNDGRVNSPYPIAVDDVSYAAPGGRVPAYLALPNKGTKLPAVIYLHGSGEGGGGSSSRRLGCREARGRHDLTLPSSSAGAPVAGLNAQSLARDRQIFAGT
jgi:acetyl esterase/lipase